MSFSRPSDLCRGSPTPVKESVPPVARSETPHASRVERTHGCWNSRARTPRTGFSPASSITASSGFTPPRYVPVAPFPRDIERRRRRSGRHRRPSRPGGTCPRPGNCVLPSVEATTYLRPFAYRIEHRDYSRVPSDVARRHSARITPMSLRRTGRTTLMVSGSTGRHRGGW